MTLLLILVAILSSFLTNLENKILQSDFVATVQEDANAPKSDYPGSITMKGKCFILSMEGIDAAYDGKTMYMFSDDTDELTLTEPTDEELMESNPLLFAKAMADQCAVTEKTENGETVITLVPKDKSPGIDRFVLRVRTADLMPLQMEVKEGKAVSTLKLTNPKFITKQPKWTIEPTETTFVNDLRF